MQQNKFYKEFALHFVDKQTDELVSSFNREVTNRGWVAKRRYYDRTLIDEFIRRGIDISAVYDGRSISFARAVKYDVKDNKLVPVS